MTEKRCCGCFSLTTGTRIVLTLSAIEATCGLFFNIELLLLMINNSPANPLSMVINQHTIEDFDVLYGIVLAAIGLYGFWLIFAGFAARGNASLSHGHLTPWVLLTYLVTLFTLGTTIYFAVKFQASIKETPEFFEGSKPTKTTTYLTLLVCSSGSGILLFLNTYFAHVVELRGKEMDHDYSMLAFYIMSHVNRCPYTHQKCTHVRCPSAPPNYSSSAPSYLPPAIAERTIESSGSSWSLSCETISPLSSCQPNSSFSTGRGKAKSFSSTNLESAFKRESQYSYQPLSNSNQSSVFPY